MKIITRYVLVELLLVFLVALTALKLFKLVVGLVREAQQQGLGLVQILMLVPYVLPEAMRFAVPGTMLFAVASVFGPSRRPGSRQWRSSGRPSRWRWW